MIHLHAKLAANLAALIHRLSICDWWCSVTSCRPVPCSFAATLVLLNTLSEKIAHSSVYLHLSQLTSNIQSSELIKIREDWVIFCAVQWINIWFNCKNTTQMLLLEKLSILVYLYLLISGVLNQRGISWAVMSTAHWADCFWECITIATKNVLECFYPGQAVALKENLKHLYNVIKFHCDMSKLYIYKAKNYCRPHSSKIICFILCLSVRPSMCMYVCLSSDCPNMTITSLYY